MLAQPGAVAHGKSGTYMLVQRILRHDAVVRCRFVGSGTPLMRIEPGGWLGVVRDNDLKPLVRPVYSSPHVRMWYLRRSVLA